MGFIRELDKARPDVTAVYHCENFLLRLTGIVDRARCLVGVSLGLDAGKLNKFGSNQFVKQPVVKPFAPTGARMLSHGRRIH